MTQAKTPKIRESRTTDNVQDKPVYRIKEKDNRVVVHAPYNRAFIEMARAIRGSYNAKNKTWSFDTSQHPLVQKMCAYAYEGKGARSSMTQTITKAMASFSGYLPPVVGKALMFSTMAVALGMNGMQGIYTAQSISKMARSLKPSVPRAFLPEGISTDYAPMNMGGQELFLERTRARLER